jgi:hypothetical protein
VALVQGRQLAADDPPDVLLLRPVVDARRALPRPPRERRGRDLVAPAAIAWIVGAGMAVVQVDDDLAARAGRDGGVQLRFFEHLIAPLS